MIEVSCLCGEAMVKDSEGSFVCHICGRRFEDGVVLAFINKELERIRKTHLEEILKRNTQMKDQLNSNNKKLAFIQGQLYFLFPLIIAVLAGVFFR